MLGSDDVVGVEELLDIPVRQLNRTACLGQGSVVSRSGLNGQGEVSKERGEESEEVSNGVHG